MKKEEYLDLNEIPEYVETEIPFPPLYDLSKRKDWLINILKKSLTDKNYTFDMNYYYKKSNGDNVFLYTMNKLYRLNALNYFNKEIKYYTNTKLIRNNENIINAEGKSELNIDLNPTNYNNYDVICRVYKNQDPTYWRNEKTRNEQDQIAVEVLFSKKLNKEHQRATAWLPRGAANFIAQELTKIKNKNYKVGIFNELDDCIGVLTSCRRNFDISINEELKENKISK